MPKRVRRKVKPVEAPSLGPHEWIFSGTKNLEEMKPGLTGTTVKLVELALKRLTVNGEFTVMKSGPGVITVLVEEEKGGKALPMSATSFEDTEPGKPAYRRMALTGGEKMVVRGFKSGSRDGVIAILYAPEGTLLGVAHDAVCEVALSGLCKAFTLADGAAIAPIITAQLAEFGEDLDALEGHLFEMEKVIAQEQAEVERKTKLRYVEERQKEYAEHNWGGW